MTDFQGSDIRVGDLVAVCVPSVSKLCKGRVVAIDYKSVRVVYKYDGESRVSVRKPAQICRIKRNRWSRNGKS